MDFKKDLWKLWYIAPLGKGRLASITYKEEELDNVQTFLLSWVLAVTTNIFDTDIVMKFLFEMTDDFDREQQKKPENERSKQNDKFYTDLIQTTIEKWNRYWYDDFDRYQNDNITAENEAFWMSLWFLSKITKLFEIWIEYVFYNWYIVWVREYTGKPLFIVWGIAMPRQQSLLEFNK